MNGGASVWAITPEERGKHDKQFDSLCPVLGYVSGEQARKFFLQSGLPPSVLAEIWNLADMESDGKMDRLEFSIAMKLIKLKLQGRNLPSALPMIMKQPPVSNSASTLPSSARFGMGSMPNLSIGFSSMSAMPILTPFQANPPMPSVQPLVPATMTLPLISSLGNSGLANGNLSLLASPLVHNKAAHPLSGFSSPMAFSPSTGMSKANSLLDLGSSSSNSSSTTSLASNSPKMGASDWAVPQASRLKYRQQFNTLDKLMSGYLSGPQVRNALMASNLTQTQLATIWTLADVDKDGQLRADEFILAMHLVDMAKTGRPLPLTLPQDLVPPSLRGGIKPSELVNGTGPYLTPCLIDTTEIESAQKTKSSVSFEDKLKENFARGSAELEKRRLALEEEQRKEKERREREEREAQERREREAREQENRRKLEEERRLERQREMERQREEERLREQERKEAAKQEMERQRREEWERAKKEELGRRREWEQEEISRLRAKKKSLELELEAVDWQRKLSLLVPEQQRLTEKLRNISLNKLSTVSVTSLTRSVTEKGVNCRRLKDQLDTLERETTDKLAQMEQYNKELKLGDMDDCVLRGLLSLLACLSQLFLLIKELREKQVRQQSVLDDLYRVKEEKLRELQRRREEEKERRRREEEEAVRRAKLEQEKRDQERREQERRQKEEEEAQQRRLLEEQRARQREEEEEREAQAHLQAAQEKAQEEERRRIQKEEEEKRRRKEAEERKRKEEEEEEKRRKEEQERVVQQPMLGAQRSSRLSTYRALYSFVARNADELSIDAGCLIESLLPLLARAISSWSATSETHLNPSTGVGDVIAALLSFSQGDIISVLQQRDDWWLGQLNGTQGWFPKSYVTLESGGNTDGDAFDSSDSIQLEEYVALYTYESPEVGDLTFVEGDVVMVTEREGEWWRGCIGDQSGVFPSNYVRPVEPEVSKPGGPTKKPEIAQAVNATVAPAMHQLRLSPGQLIVVLAKNSSSWWLGELQARGKKRQRGWFHSSHVKLLGPSSSKSCPSPLPVCQVIAMYDYTAANRDELSFSKGQLINILDKTNPDWWKGEASGVIGLLPTNYVKMTTESDPSQQSPLPPPAPLSHPSCLSQSELPCRNRKPCRQQEQPSSAPSFPPHSFRTVVFCAPLFVFYKPMSESGRLTEAEMGVIFVNWRELIMCNTKLLKALRVRKKTGGDNMPVQLIGDLLASELAHMQPYIRFCSCQLNAAALLQSKTYNQPDFKNFLKKIATNYRCKGMPLSSFLLKPMQRITRYPLLIKNILEHTPECHADRGPLREALDRAEELCSQVNEGVREKENSDRLEWIQSHVQCEGPIEHLVFNSLTNCLGPRKLLHSGRLYKSKSSRELWTFLFNDFLLLTHSAKPFSSSGPDKLFSPKTNIQLKMYKTPLFLNEVLVKMPPDPSSDEPLFHVSHIDRVYTLKTETLNERATWVQKIKAASEHFIETEKKKREKAYQARSLKTSGIGRLLVTVTEAQELKACKPNGKSNPYCELTMGAQCYTSRPVGDTLNPKWNFNCQFFIKDLYQDVLCITVFEKDQFSPDDFLGRTEVPVATIKKEMESKGAANRRLLLHEVPTGEVWVKLDLQLYEPAK
ncbi:Intersectin-2 SH3 domain-containing protein 1B SH3P18 SH3P18-like WASP-associated protein [Channa argus]|uniref:Intersectin-2 SH3 domain-containing protein 1B SH3P18 SH3P18-like WASP-associated protein n=1 Tax=Channa argus TaxID=215402 RepID=A0A6G1QKC8_CHAAH|nr:Intersectin-2 SH3 domain-containing protein 1B SH3P18 SH3P18-like WASP-associated protein [Channa argus]